MEKKQKLCQIYIYKSMQCIRRKENSIKYGLKTVLQSNNKPYVK